MARVEQSFNAHSKSINAQGQYTGVEIPYVVFDAESEEEALAAVFEMAPRSCHNISLESIEIDNRENDTTYRVNAVYKPGGEIEDDEEEDVATASFDCGGGSKHITHSIEQRMVFGEKEAGGAIGWNGKSGSEMEVAGVDIPTAQLRETYTKSMRVSRLTTDYKRNVARLVGKVNSNGFKGWAAGEVMFLGMSYSTPSKNASKVTVTYNFSIQPNETDSKIGEHKVSKKGWEYAWALSTTHSEDGTPKVKIDGVYIDKVCEEADFGALQL